MTIYEISRRLSLGPYLDADLATLFDKPKRALHGRQPRDMVGASWMKKEVLHVDHDQSTKACCYRDRRVLGAMRGTNAKPGRRRSAASEIVRLGVSIIYPFVVLRPQPYRRRHSGYLVRRESEEGKKKFGLRKGCDTYTRDVE